MKSNEDPESMNVSHFAKAEPSDFVTACESVNYYYYKLDEIVKWGIENISGGLEIVYDYAVKGVGATS